MKRIIKVVVIGILAVLFVFIGWMNLTPGHFQEYPCGCGVSYKLNYEYLPHELPPPCPAVVCQAYKAMALTSILVPLSYLDFNK